MGWAPIMLVFFVAAGAPGKAQGLRAGAARMDITPPVDPADPPSGKYAHEKLHLRAIVLDNGATRAALIGAGKDSCRIVTLQPRLGGGYFHCVAAS